MMFWIFGAMFVLLAGIMSVFLMNWPWRWADKQKLAKHPAKDENCLVEMRSHWWAKWKRLATLTWVTVREYSVLYADKEGRRHQAMAEFYLPWWLNKLYDSGLEDN